MSSSKLCFDLLTSDVAKGIENEAVKKLAEYRKSGQILKEEVFSILEKNCTALYYPMFDDEICGFIVKHGVNHFSCINTETPLEKQLFAAAHELYHLWYTKEQSWEILKSVILDGCVNGGNSIEDVKANRFAAEFMVPKHLLYQELDLRNAKRNEISNEIIVELMDVFLMPYKTIVRRLFEIDYINEKQCLEFLEIPDRDENESILLLQKRLSLCTRNNVRTRIKKYGKLVEMSLRLYENRQITYEKLVFLLNLVDQTPEEHNIQKPTTHLFSEEEIEKFLEEED